MEFHLESLRSIPLAELGTAQQPAWLAQPAAAADLKWELDRLGGQPPPPAAAGKDPAAPSWGHAPGAEGKPAAFAAELDDLAKELADPGRGRKEKRKGRRGKSPERRSPKPHAREKARGPVADAEAALEKKRRRWLNPDGHCSVSSGSELSRGRSPQKPRRVGREKKKKKKKRSRSRDPGPPC